MALELVDLPRRKHPVSVPRPRIRKGPKKHGVNRRRSHLARKKAARAKQQWIEHVAVVRAYNEAMAAYFRGERDAPPEPYSATHLLRG